MKLPSIVICDILSKERILGEDPQFNLKCKFEMSVKQSYVFI